MKNQRILYASPFVPAEWIAAHGLEPFRHFPASQAGASLAGSNEGFCPFAQAYAAEAAAADAAAAVFATTCDQMRRASELVPSTASRPLFLFNVPATWRSAQASTLYREELLRLGRFLVRLGGASPPPEKLAAVMLSYDNARQALQQTRGESSAREAAEALVALYQQGVLDVQSRDRKDRRELAQRRDRLLTRAARTAPIFSGAALGTEHSARLAVLGGPVLREQFGLYDEIERAGARVVLDATETGERTLPAPFDRVRLRADPLEELARAYFQHIPDAFRRPNDRLYEWLATELSTRRVQGILLLRCVWCDLWHAEAARLKERLKLPVLELEPSGMAAEMPRTQVRLQALLEIFT